MYAQNTYFLNFIYKIQPITTIIVKKKKIRVSLSIFSIFWSWDMMFFFPHFLLWFGLDPGAYLKF